MNRKNKRLKSLQKIRRKQLEKPSKFELVFKAKLNQWDIEYQWQQIIMGYIADFYLPFFNLIIEIDGAAHYTYGLERDKKRDAKLKQAGYKVHRIRNSEVAIYQKEDLLDVIKPIAPKPEMIEDRMFHKSYLDNLI
jgi:very-short-patch-repair endonuclease